MIHPMNRLLALCMSCLTLSATGCGEREPDPPLPPETASSPLATEMVTAHNAVRAGATPTPEPALTPLTWSNDAATVAQTYAAQCLFEHNKNRGPYGENLAAAAPPGSKADAEVVHDWASEASDYSYTKNTCAPDKVCGHYTQVVWRKTTQVGCATVLCTKNSPFGARFPEWQLWVCNYTPPGNYVGQRPY
jgi:pathogenesis-related protein 1